MTPVLWSTHFLIFVNCPPDVVEICNPDTLCGPVGMNAYQWNFNGPHTRRNHAMSGDNPVEVIHWQPPTHFVHCNFRYPNSGCSAVLRLNRYRSFSWSSWPYTWWLLLFNFSRKQLDSLFICRHGQTGAIFLLPRAVLLLAGCKPHLQLLHYIRQQHPSGSPLPTGASNNIAEVCFEEAIESPLVIYFNWIGPDDENYVWIQ